MDLHILSDPVSCFRKCTKKGFKNDLLAFKKNSGGLIGSTKTLFKNLKFGMVVNWQKQKILNSKKCV